MKTDPEDDFDIGSFGLSVVQEKIENRKIGKEIFNPNTGTLTAAKGVPDLAGIKVEADSILEEANWDLFDIEVDEGSLKDPKKRADRESVRRRVGAKQSITTEPGDGALRFNKKKKGEKTISNKMTAVSQYGKRYQEKKPLPQAGPKGKLPEGKLIELTEAIVNLTRIIREITSVGALGTNMAGPQKKKVKKKTKLSKLYKGYGK